MFRLRDNFLAVFGLDNTDPDPVAQPVISIEATESADLQDTTEMRLTILGDRSESFRVENALRGNSAPGGVAAIVTNEPAVFFKAVATLAGPIIEFVGSVSNVRVITTYAAGVPTAVSVLMSYIERTGAPDGAAQASAVPITNTWTDVFVATASTGNVYRLQAKVRSDASGLLIAFRTSGTTGTPTPGGPWIRGHGIRSYQVAKG
jgi:hypothetical protein